MGHHSKDKGKERARKRLPDSSSKVKKLLDQVAEERDKHMKHYNDFAKNTKKAEEYQQRLDEEQGQLDQLSDSADAAQRARGYVPDPEGSYEQEMYRRHTRRADFERSIGTLQDSVRHYQRKANEALAKYNETAEEINALEIKLQSLGENPTYDLDNWFIPGSDRHPDYDEDGPSGSATWAGAGPAY